ncbi:LysR family transcriptional regulator [Kiloniella sp.]|uniref:LysR family transcriptional regulator n=1 Tax=Kiloniella sp. TaxID=1938587 RepID=UPI003B0283AE
MEIHQLKTFVAVAREGSITRASEQLFLSQPAVSAHIKAIEDTLGVTLFERNPKGMSLTREGKRLLSKAEQTLGAHRELIEEASRIKGHLSGKLNLGAGSNSSTEALERLIKVFSERFPEVEVAVKHGDSHETINAIRNGSLDAGFYNDAGTSDPTPDPDPVLSTLAVSHFGIYLAAAPGLVPRSKPLDWQALAQMPWICPPANSCCGKAVKNLFETHQIRPERIINIDRESVARSLIAGGVGIGLLHTDTAVDAQSLGEVDLLCEAHKSARVLFSHLQGRANDPLLSEVRTILQEPSNA